MKQRIPHRLAQRFYGVDPGETLNCSGKTRQAGDLNLQELRAALNEIKRLAFHPHGEKVDYQALRESVLMQEYRALSDRLCNFDPGSLTTPEERLAFWINLYNALIIDGVLAFGIQESIQEVPGFFMKAAYHIGGYRFSADDIEHGILRANRGHPAIPGPQFGRGDPRRPYSLTKLDPRIHFALNCASESCPPIGFYQAGLIHQQLDLAVQSFVNQGGVIIDLENETIHLSRIFLWYASDFGGPIFGLGNMRPVLNFISDYLLADELASCVRETNFKINYLPYDWGLNH